jgi:hypothetical protein
MQVQQNGVGTGQAAEAPQISSMDESAEQPLPGLDQEIDYPSVLNKVCEHVAGSMLIGTSRSSRG